MYVFSCSRSNCANNTVPLLSISRLCTSSTGYGARTTPRKAASISFLSYSFPCPLMSDDSMPQSVSLLPLLMNSLSPSFRMLCLGGQTSEIGRTMRRQTLWSRPAETSQSRRCLCLVRKRAHWQKHSPHSSREARQKLNGMDRMGEWEGRMNGPSISFRTTPSLLWLTRVEAKGRDEKIARRSLARL